jgi:predicted nucleotidyltransferase
MSLTQLPKIDKLINELRVSMESTLDGRLRGLYLFGSLVGGDFDSLASDIDFLAITESDITSAELPQLRDMHDTFECMHPKWKDRIEVAYVGVEAMQRFKTKTVRIARISPGEPLHFRDMDIEWLMDWYMVQEQGLAVTGPSPKTYIPEITREEFIASLKRGLPDWAERANEARRIGYQSYIVLSLCRNVYAIRFGAQVSKFKGATWAKGEYPEWAELISQAIEWHGSPDTSDSLTTKAETINFARFMTTQV